VFAQQPDCLGVQPDLPSAASCLGFAFHDLASELQDRVVDAEVSGVEVGAGPAEAAQFAAAAAAQDRDAEHQAERVCRGHGKEAAGLGSTPSLGFGCFFGFQPDGVDRVEHQAVRHLDLKVQDCAQGREDAMLDATPMIFGRCRTSPWTLIVFLPAARPAAPDARPGGVRWTQDDTMRTRAACGRELSDTRRRAWRARGRRMSAARWAHVYGQAH
jgi:hypothetical protein